MTYDFTATSSERGVSAVLKMMVSLLIGLFIQEHPQMALKFVMITHYPKRLVDKSFSDTLTFPVVPPHEQIFPFHTGHCWADCQFECAQAPPEEKVEIC